MKLLCTIQDGQKMLREVNPYDKEFKWNAWQAFERYVQHHMNPCDIPDLKPGDTIEDWECELVERLRRANDRFEVYQTYVRKGGVSEEKDHFYKLVGMIGNQMLEPDKTGHEMYEEFKQQGYTITKKI